MSNRRFTVVTLAGLLAGMLLVGSATLVLSQRQAPPELLSREKLFRLPVTSVDWSATGVIAAGSEDRSVRIWRPAGGPRTELTDFDGSIAEVRWSPNGRRLAIVSNEPTRPLRVWDLATEKTQYLRDPDSQAMISAMEWSSDGSSLAVGTNDRPMGPRDGGSVYIVDATTGAVAHRIRTSEPINAVAWSQSGRRLAGGMSSASLMTPTITLQVWEVLGSEPMFQAEGTEFVEDLAWAADDNRLAVGSLDGLIQVWDLRRDVLLHSMQVDGPKTGRIALTPVKALEWSPDGKLLASGSWDDYLRIWDGSNFALKSEYVNPDYVNDVSWSPDGKAVVVGCANGEVLIWSVK
jgi:WD40 repeat protein